MSNFCHRFYAFLLIQLSFNEANEVMSDDPERFKALVKERLAFFITKETKVTVPPDLRSPRRGPFLVVLDSPTLLPPKYLPELGCWSI